MSFLISDAVAATTATGSSGLGSSAEAGFPFLMFIAIFIVFYFMLIRPQNKRAKEHRALVSNLKKGDEIITAGGIVAKVTALDEQYIKISPSEGIELTIQRNSISTVLPKGTLKSL